MNYTQLQTLVGNYLDRSDLSSYIPGFITRCENSLNRKLRLLQMNEQTTDTFQSSDLRYLDLPSGFLELTNLVIKPAADADTSYTTPLYVSAQMLPEYYETTGTPRYFTIRDQVEFNCGVSADHTVRFDYIKKWDIATDTTNWLLTNFEDAYLYGALLGAEPFLKSDERVPLWKAMFDEVMTELNDLDERSQDDAILGTDLYLLNNRRYSVLND